MLNAWKMTGNYCILYTVFFIYLFIFAKDSSHVLTLCQMHSDKTPVNHYGTVCSWILYTILITPCKGMETVDLTTACISLYTVRIHFFFPNINISA